MTALLSLAITLLSVPTQHVGWQHPFEVLPTPPVVGPLAERLVKGKTSAVWLDGNVLNFLCKSPEAELKLSGGIQKAMSKIPGSDLWILRLKMEGWDKAMVTYMFTGGQGPQATPQVWRGVNAPPQPVRVKREELKGQLIRRTIDSPNLGEERAVDVYLPPDAPKSGLPAFFIADGGACASFAQVLEPLILSGKVRPVAIVGAYSGTYHGKQGSYDPLQDYRMQEYVPGYSRYARHMAFFADELTKWATVEYGISTSRQDRAISGFSNGGSFAAGAAIRRPDVFGAAIPMSAGIHSADPRPSMRLPRMFLIAGTLESFSRPTREIYEKVKGWGADASLTLYTAGHDFEMWLLGFAEMAPEVFPPKP